MLGPLVRVLSRRRDRTESATDAENDDADREATGGSGRRRLWILFVLATAVAYHARIRPWHRQWGTSPRERIGELPGDELVSEPADQVTHAVEVDASPDEVWQWLVQLGQNRGGFYSYDFLENLVGADIHTVDRIVPAYQELSEGDVIRLAPEDYAASRPDSAPEVAHIEENRALVLQPPVDGPTWAWAFVCRETEEGTTRLVARMRSPESSASWLEAALEYLFWEPAHFVMERKMLLEIKRRAESSEPTPIEIEID